MKGAIRKGLVAITVLSAIVCGGMFLVVLDHLNGEGDGVFLTYNMCDTAGAGIDESTGIFLTVPFILVTCFPLFQRLKSRSSLFFPPPFAKVLTPPG